MKKGFLPFVLSSLGLLIGISSCQKEKNCTNCFTVTYTGGGSGGLVKYRYCQDEFATAAEYNAILDTARAQGAQGITTEILCEK